MGRRPGPDDVAATGSPAGADADAVLAEERALLRGLALWAGASVVAGTVARAAGRVAGRRPPGHAGPGRPDPVLPGVARQAVGWGAVDLALVALGRRGLRRAAADGLDPAAAAARARRMARITAVNAAADVGYVALGAALAARSPRRRGDGLGVVVQGLALLWLDVRHSAAFGRLSSAVPGRAVGPRP